MKFPKTNMTKQERNSYLVAFFVPIFVMIMIFFIRGIYPFGTKSFLRTDLYHQYAPFYQTLREKLQTGESLFYSWNIGAGTNFLALFAYYLSSPFNILLVLVPAAHVIEFMTILVVLKIALCGFTFTWYLQHHGKEPFFHACFFGIAYALSGYIAAYSWNIMWLDCIWAFPLVILGLEYLIQGKKASLYLVSLAFSILTNYYISIMTCAFLVFYFIMMVLIQDEMQWKKVLKQIGRFSLYSLLAGGIAAILLLPEIQQLSMTASSNSKFPTSVTEYFSILQMLARHLDVVETQQGLDHWPNIFCGVAVFMLIPLYVMNKKYSWKEKAGYAVLIFFLLASFSLNVLNYIWHGMHYPNSLPCRQSFVYIFLILVMSYKGLQGVPERPVRQLTIAVWIAIGLIVLIQAVCQDEDITWYVIWASLAFTGLYALLIFLFQKPNTDRFLIAFAAVLLLIVENTINTGVTSVTTTSRDIYTDLDELAPEYLNQIAVEDEDLFYRVEKVSHRTKNDGAWLMYPSASTFSSMSYSHMSSFYKQLGMESSTNAYSTNGATPFTYALFGIRYLFSTDTLRESSLYTDIRQEQYVSGTVDRTLHLYRNTFSLGAGVVIPSSMSGYQVSSASPFSAQNYLLQGMSNTSEDLFTTLNVNTSGKTATVYVEESGFVYLSVNGNTKDVQVSHTGFTKTFNNTNRGYLMNIGWCEAGDTITATPTDSSATSISINAGMFNVSAFEAAMEALMPNRLQVSTWTDTHLEGTVSGDGGLLLFSIPYDEGWKVQIDGQDVTPARFSDALLAVSVADGTHSVTLDYTPPGFSAGWKISLLCVLISAVLLILPDRIRRKKERITEKDSGPDMSEAEEADPVLFPSSLSSETKTDISN